MSTDCLKLTCYFGERHRAGGVFVADALLDLYGRREVAASVLLRGTEGFGLRQHLRSDRSLTLSEDLPLVAVAVDTRPRIEAVLPLVAALASPGLVTLERARLLDGTAAPGGPGGAVLPGGPDGAVLRGDWTARCWRGAWTARCWRGAWTARRRPGTRAARPS